MSTALAPEALTDAAVQTPPAAGAGMSAPGRVHVLDLDARRQRVLEALLRGTHAPLRGFLGRADYNRVVEERCLVDGSPCEVPVTLDVSEAFSAGLCAGSEVLLRGRDGTPLAVLEVEDIYWPDHLYEARRVHGSSDRAHPRVAELLDEAGPVYLGGRVRPAAH